MKITLATQKPKFEPYTLEIRVDSFTEHVALAKLAFLFNTVPQCVKDNDVSLTVDQQDCLSTMLDTLYDAMPCRESEDQP